MSNVITLASRKASPPTSPTIANAPTLERQQAIENALNMALFYVRTTDTPQGMRAAMVKAMRAATMLKQSCAESSIGGRA